MNRNLGIDIKLTQGRPSISQSGDLAWTGGTDNLEQALRHRIRTCIGALRFHPSYGSSVPKMLSRPNTTVMLGMVYSSISKVLMQEPRIESVKEFSITKENPTTISISLAVVAIGETNERNILLEVDFLS